MICIVSTLFPLQYTSIFFPTTSDNGTGFFDLPKIKTVVDNIDTAKREFLKDNITDNFHSSWFESLNAKGKNEYVSSLISVKRRLLSFTTL